METTLLLLAALLFAGSACAAPVDSLESQDTQDSKQGMLYGFGSPLYGGLPGTNYGGVMGIPPRGFLGAQRYPSAFPYQTSMGFPSPMGLPISPSYPGSLGYGGGMGMPLSQGFGGLSGYPPMSGMMSPYLQPETTMMFRKKGEKSEKSRH